MPRFPALSPTLANVGASVFSSLAGRLATFEGEIYPLHIGDTWMDPPEGCHMEDLRTAEHANLHRYTSPQGHRGLVDALVLESERRFGHASNRKEILVTAGATGGLGAVVGAVVAPGEEVLIAAPYWPLIAGIVSSFHGRPIAVPLIGAVETAAEAVAAFEAHLRPETCALYLSSPNNPTGAVLPTDWIEAVVSWAASQGLWVFADEVYEDYVYEGEHRYARALAPERTFSVHSFSKAYGMTGNRCGWVAGPADVMGSVRKVSTHTFYSTPTASQVAALRALGPSGRRWIERARRLYYDLGRRAADRLGLAPPQGSSFLFVDVAAALDGRDLLAFLEACAEQGLFLAPGPSFGPYPTHVRLCFTSAEPELVLRGVDVLARQLG